uniref:Uncharacterized protein n=1 Tax=Tanacetum cinerariifolium TaxID=118510 RepID=A0A699HN46_TANCI|nr:hypothetical protein [Tanacetum cinerariifolium]
MANFTFADSHNMVAHLEKLAENADFVEIVDFLNVNPIRKTKRKATEISQSSGPTTRVAYETVHEERGDIVERAATTAASLDAKQDSGGSPRLQYTILGDRPAQTRFKRLSKLFHEPPLSRVNTLGSGEDSMQLMELMELCTKLSDRVLALENNKTAQELEITHLKKRVKRLEKKTKSRTPQFKRRLFKVRIETFAKNSLGDQEDASNQGRNDQDKGISFVQDEKIQGRYGYDTEINTASTSITTASINITTVEPVPIVSAPITTAGVSVSTIEPNHELAERLQSEEQGELTIEERLKLFVELMNQRKKHFARLKAEEKRRKPPTKAQKRNQMCGETRAKGSSKRAREELEYDKSKKQKLDEKVEAEVDSDQEEEKMKRYMNIVPDDEIAIDDIPLATKPPIIVDCKIIKEGKISSYHIIRADGSSKRTEEAYERVLQSDLKVMFEPNIESALWRKLQGNKLTVWKLLSSCEVHFVRFQNLHIFMLVEKRYPLTPATITKMLNMKLQADHWNEICYQLLKLMLKQQKKCLDTSY